MNKTYHKFLIVFVIFVAFGGVYIYFSNSTESEASLTSSLESSVPEDLGSSDDRINADIAFISSLDSLNNIKIDTALFANKAFQSLRNNAVELEPVNPGRLNPFAPIAETSVYSSVVSTNKPTEIKDKDAVLNGSINNTEKTGVGYFEYGPTRELGQKTSQVSVSLIGTFISNVTGFESKTTYFYKACAKISGATFCGDIVSFETN